MIGKVHSLVAAAATPLRYTAHDSTSILQNNGTLRYGHPGADILGSYFQVHLDGRASKVDGDRAAAADQSVQHALTPEASERHLTPPCSDAAKVCLPISSCTFRESRLEGRRSFRFQSLFYDSALLFVWVRAGREETITPRGSCYFTFALEGRGRGGTANCTGVRLTTVTRIPCRNLWLLRHACSCCILVRVGTVVRHPGRGERC